MADTEWQSYSDYATVTKRIAESIDDAVDAYASIRARHAADAAVPPDHAAEARGRILAAALRLEVELRENIEADADDLPDSPAAVAEDKYAEILVRWINGDGNGTHGYFDEIDAVELREECPEWLGQFVRDIRTAGWRLGYLRAGETTKKTPDDASDEQVKAMMEDMA